MKPHSGKPHSGKPHSRDNGIEYLTALVRAQFDPDAAEPPLPGNKTKQKSNEPRTIPELRQKMAQRLAEKIRKEFQPDGIGSLFVLTERQAATLEALELPQELTEEVLSLNWLREEMSNYAVNDRLEIIATMPPSDEGKKPDWNKWWMDHAGSGIGVHRPQDHDPLKDPLSEMLNQVISAMARAAAPEIPNHGKMARHMLEFGVPEAFSNRRTKPKNKKLDLTQVWIMGRKNTQPGMANWNNRAGTSSPKAGQPGGAAGGARRAGNPGTPGHGDGHRTGGTQENAARGKHRTYVRQRPERTVARLEGQRKPPARPPGVRQQRPKPNPPPGSRRGRRDQDAGRMAPDDAHRTGSTQERRTSPSSARTGRHPTSAS